MDVKQELTEARQKQKQVVDQINATRQQEQQLLQEALKLEGEIRALTRLVEGPTSSAPGAHKSHKKGH